MKTEVRARVEGTIPRWRKNVVRGMDVVQLAPEARRSRASGHSRMRAVVGVAALAAALALAALIAFAPRASEPPAEPYSITACRDEWESAMHKAGVTATFPNEPVSLTHVEATGAHDFSATFTEAEVAALLTVYRFESRVYGERAALERVDVDFPTPGNARITGRVSLRGDPYLAKAEAPVSFDGERIIIEQQRTQLSVEGFSVGGRQRERVVSMLSTYVNDLLLASPGLSVESATIVTGGVRVTGTAPDRITNPTVNDPAPLEGLDVAQLR